MTLEDIRGEIDGIDTQMKELFLKRMEMSKQVAKAKAITGGDVYVADREREIIKRRVAGVEQSLYPQYTAFLKYVMCVSRMYQYSLLDGMQQKNLKLLPEGEGEIILKFCCEPCNFHQFAEAIDLAGVTIIEMRLENKGDCGQSCRMRLSGDFSYTLAKAAVLQILKETSYAQIEVLSP